VDLSLLADELGEDRLKQISDEDDLTKSEISFYLHAWVDAVFQAPDADICPGYALDKLDGSDGSHCYCLYLVTGYSFSELDYEVIDLALSRGQAMQRLRENVGLVYEEWAADPDIERLLAYLEMTSLAN